MALFDEIMKIVKDHHEKLKDLEIKSRGKPNAE
jgi:hypothetical protein